MDKKEKHIFIHQEMVLRAQREWKLPTVGLTAMNWFRQKMQENYTKNDAKLIFEDRTRLKFRPILGKMYFFRYDPKWKAELPYYDSFPLVLPIKFYDDGFAGLNLHYLPYQHRAFLMDGLIRTVNRTTFDEKTKMRVTYDLLTSAAKYHWFKPTLKRYLSSHIKTRLVEVHAQEWPMALFLPVQQWRKASERQIWADSIKVANG